MQRTQGTRQSYRSKGIAEHESGGLEAWGGIVSAHLEDWAAELDCTPDEVLGTVDTAGINPVTDTGTSKGHEDHDRPTDAELRCLALTTEDAQTLKNILSR